MNDIDKNILTELLTAPEFWEPIKQQRIVTGYKLKLRYVHQQLRLAKEILFYDQVYFPRTQRIMRLIKKMEIVPAAVGWQELEVGMNVEIKIWYPCEIEWQEYLSDCFEPYFQDRWMDEWCNDEPNENEILELGIRPALLEAIQEKLF